MHHIHLLIRHSLHTCILSITNNYGHLKYVKDIAHNSEAVGQDVGMVYAWMCQEAGVACTKIAF